jgi:hypothetical protein
MAMRPYGGGECSMRRGAAKEIQMANGKEQMANAKPFEFCYLPFAI